MADLRNSVQEILAQDAATPVVRQIRWGRHRPEIVPPVEETPTNGKALALVVWPKLGPPCVETKNAAAKTAGRMQRDRKRGRIRPPSGRVGYAVLRRSRCFRLTHQVKLRAHDSTGSRC